jgi:hypothetical protein
MGNIKPKGTLMIIKANGSTYPCIYGRSFISHGIYDKTTLSGGECFPMFPHQFDRFIDKDNVKSMSAETKEILNSHEKDGRWPWEK